MAKNSVADWDATAANNTDVGGIDVNEGCPSANINNAIREVMAQVKTYSGTVPALASVNTYTKIQKWAKGADVASASTLTLGDDGNYFDITGTTAITAIATKGVGTRVLLQFDAALTLTHHATDLVLPGGVNITTAAGDHAEFVEYATGDWRCTNYFGASAAQATVDVASATTTDIGAAASENVRITGTTTITGFGTVAEGTLRFVRMAGALTLTHNATSLILPGGANITTAANDCFIARSLGSGNWLVMSYQRAAILPTMGQIKFGTLSTAFSTTSTTYQDTGLQVIITPISATSKILVQCASPMNIQANGSTTNPTGDIIIERNGTTVCGANVSYRFPTADASNHVREPHSLLAVDSPASTSALTYKFRIKAGSNTTIAASYLDALSTIIVTEIIA